jgi:tripartite-type tricarboxylate transporter receptor subunit TctC
MQLLNRLAILGAALLACAVALAQPAAENFPQKPVTIIVPWSAGGGTDNVVRRYAQGLSQLWGQPVVVENMAGASSIIGAQRVTRSEPNGYTLLGTTNPTITGNTFLFKKLPYSPETDLLPISQLADVDMLVLASADFPANNLKELVALAKKEPGRVTYASYGKGSQPELLFGLFAKREQMELTHVPYKGVSDALTSVMSGAAALTLTGRGTGASALASGKGKALAYMSTERDPLMPNVPTAIESGYPYLKIPTWHGLFAPAGTPPAIIEKIQRDLVTVATPAFRADMAKLGYKVPVSTPAEFAAVIKDELKLTAEMVEAAGLKSE